MRRVACFILAALSGAAVFGQGLLDCIEPDVLHALLLPAQGGQSPIITATVPREIASLKMPGEFTWIGSAERTLGIPGATPAVAQVTAAWRASLGPDAAHAATAAALTASGWDVRPPPGIGRAVFSLPISQVVQAACRDGRPVNVNTGVMDGATYVLLSLQRGGVETSVCNQQERPAVVVGATLDPFLPRLDMPVDPETGQPALLSGTGVSRSANKISARAEIILKESAGGIARHFARQMADQGWTNDAQWDGAATAGSTWSRRRDGGARLHASLSVMAVEGQNIVAVLRVIESQ